VRDLGYEYRYEYWMFRTHIRVPDVPYSYMIGWMRMGTGCSVLAYDWSDVYGYRMYRTDVYGYRMYRTRI
jgi:hypothetical protein